ncbi:hypothetical protein K435DRAFT_562059, partial [Dendrothele bispora CBS 962.96]
LAFGGVHCAPWNSTFPTRWERVIWRVSAVTVTAFPVALLTVILIGISTTDMVPVEEISNFISNIAFLFLPLVYIWARIALIGTALAELRALPPDAYRTVDWARLIPHI